jgi:ATPase subunit of ABC transporter with duplicated ATPase domains
LRAGAPPGRHVTEQQARRALGMCGLAGERHLCRMEQLSGGQKARVVFASLALLRPHVLLCGGGRCVLV